MRYSWKFKLECVEQYLVGEWAEKPKQANCSKERFRKEIREWVRSYEIHGIDGLRHKIQNKEWTAQERYELVAKVLAGKSIRAVALEAGTNPGLLYQWVRKYKQYGYDGLQLKKGRKPKDPNMKHNDTKEELTRSEKEELILLREQNEYLKAENAYLKKLRALVAQKKMESSAKARKQGSFKDSGQMDTD